MIDSDEQDLFPGAQANTATHPNEIRTPTVKRKERIRTCQETKCLLQKPNPQIFCEA